MDKGDVINCVIVDDHTIQCSKCSTIIKVKNQEDFEPLVNHVNNECNGIRNRNREKIFCSSFFNHFAFISFF